VFTADKKPSIDVTMIMAVVLRPWATVIDGYEAEREKLGWAPCAMVIVNAVEWLRLPLVPMIWKLNVPVGADDATLTDIVELPGAVGLGEKTICTPEGTPLLVERPI
jgi:hypothetical protein